MRGFLWRVPSSNPRGLSDKNGVISPETDNLLNHWRLAVHGLAVELENHVPGIEPALKQVLSDFRVNELPEGFSATVGEIRRYEVAEVQRHVSARAVAVPQARAMLELYRDGENYWLLDERWGLTEINLLRGRWTSWMLANPLIDPLRAMEQAVLWPLAQLLRPRGLYLVPAVSVVRDGFAVLILSPFSLEPELEAMVRAGYRIIGQRWTALREEDGRVAMLHVPGMIERNQPPRTRSRQTPAQGPMDPLANWVDLMGVYLGTRQNHAFCDAVLLAEPGRRLHPHLRELNHVTAMNVLRRNWPIVELNPQRRSGQLPVRLAQHCRVAELQLSRKASDLLMLLDSLRKSPRPTMATAGMPALSLYVPKVRQLAG